MNFEIFYNHKPKDKNQKFVYTLRQMQEKNEKIRIAM